MRTPELARGLHLGLEDPLAPAREDVVVVEDGRAARERELGEPCARRGVLGLRVDPGPDGIELAQPREEVGLLRASARQRLVQVVMRVDEPGGDDRAPQVDSRGVHPAPSRARSTTTIAPSTSTQPFGCSVPASSIVTIQPFA